MRLLILLIIFAILGFVASASLHVLSLLHIYEPTKTVSLLITIGGFLMVYMATFISKQSRGNIEPKVYRKMLFDISPKWISTLVGFLVLYAIAGLLYYAIRRHSGAAVLSSGKETLQRFTGHWMALYALTLMILDSYQRYKKMNSSQLGMTKFAF